MLPENFKLADYLQRIAYSGEVKADYATLKQLMACQLQNVPFENLAYRVCEFMKTLIPENEWNKQAEEI